MIRRLTSEDVYLYRSLMLEAYDSHPDAFTSTAQERDALPITWWVKRLEPQENAIEVVFGAFQGSNLAGVAGLKFETRAKVHHKATLFGMYVAKPFRKLGLGYQLVQAAIDYAKVKSQVKLIQLTVTQGNDAAEKLYQRCGFERFGVEPLAVFVQPSYVSKIHMWCDLNRYRSVIQR